MTAVVNSNTQFALDLYKQVGATAGEDNIILSPYSVSTALAMTYAGSRKKTQKQMADVLQSTRQMRACWMGSPRCWGKPGLLPAKI